MKARQLIEAGAITIDKQARDLEEAWNELPASALTVQDFRRLEQMVKDLHQMSSDLVQINIALQLPGGTHETPKP